jgi:DNA-binding transcriptional regulator YiaG
LGIDTHTSKHGERRAACPTMKGRQFANMVGQAFSLSTFCINPRTLQEWEQGRRKPDATTRAYLAVIAKNCAAVLKALAS